MIRGAQKWLKRPPETCETASAPMARLKIQLVAWRVYFNSHQPVRHAEFNWIPHEARPGQSNISTGPTFSMPFQGAVRRAPDYTSEILVRAADGGSRIEPLF